MKAVLLAVLLSCSFSAMAVLPKVDDSEFPQTVVKNMGYHEVTELDCYAVEQTVLGIAMARDTNVSQATVLRSFFQPKNLEREGYRALLPEIMLASNDVYNSRDLSGPALGDKHFKACMVNLGKVQQFYK